MPTSSTAIADRQLLQIKDLAKSTDRIRTQKSDDFLTIESALPENDRKRLYKRSHTILNESVCHKTICDQVNIQTYPDGFVHVSQTEKEKENKISLDRRGLTSVPIIDASQKLHLLSLQHNLITNLDGFKSQNFPYLVFLDIYDNQLDHISNLSALDNLRVLLIGKNRLKKIEGLGNLKKVEVLDLHGNQITHISGLKDLIELKILNLAGNQIRHIGTLDLQGLKSLQEINLRRNKLKKLLGFGETPSLTKMFLNNNDLQSVEDISSLAKLLNLKEIFIDNNPVFLNGDCVSFLVSYLPQLLKINSIQISDQVRKAAMAWRRNKESSNATFMALTTDVTLNVHREEIISNARTNWELIRSQSKYLNTIKSSSSVGKIMKNLNPNTDFILTSLTKQDKPPLVRPKSVRSYLGPKVPILKKKLVRTNSQDTENSGNTSSSSTEFFKLPPILFPIIHEMEQKNASKDSGIKLSDSLSSIGPNFDSSVGSIDSDNTDNESSESSSSDFSNHSETKEENKVEKKPELIIDCKINSDNTNNTTQNKNASIETTNKPPSNGSVSSISTNPKPEKLIRNTNSAVTTQVNNTKLLSRAATAKPKRIASPLILKDREQGGDYLIEICGRQLNVYGHCALRFIDKPWNQSQASEVNSVKFSYVNFSGIAGTFKKLKLRFPNIEHFFFKETNIYCLGQLNALADVQGLTSLNIDPEGNPITQKNWESYAIYRLSHWGLRIINEKEITTEDFRVANEEYRSLCDLVLWSLPDVILQPLLNRLRLDAGIAEQSVKKWLLTADPALKSVVSKEALQWKKGIITQEDLRLRQKAKQHFSLLLDEMSNAVNKLRLLDEKWPAILQEFVQNTLVDYSHLDIYMKQKLQKLTKS